MQKQKILFNILILSFLIQSTWASELAISKNSSGVLSLSGASCNELLAQKESLCTWKNQLEGTTQQSNQSCQNNNSLSLNQCLPTFVQKTHKTKLYRSGPNCWGTALFLAGMSPAPRFVFPQEMLYWLQSPICRKLGPSENLKSGDIINVFAPEYLSTDGDYLENDAGTDFWKALFPNRYTRVQKNPNGSNYTGYHTLFHSVTLASSAIVFGKDSQLAEDRFYLHLLSEIYGRPRDEQDCKENQTFEPYLREYQRAPKNIKGEKCAYFTNVFRCENFISFFNSLNLNSEQETLLTQIKSLQEKQKTLFPFVTQKDFSLSSTLKNQFLAEANQRSTEALTKLKNLPSDKNVEMLLTLQFFTAEAIKVSLDQAQGD